MPHPGEVQPIRNITGSALDMTIQPHAPISGQDAGTITISARDSVDSARNGGGLVVRSGNGGNAAYGGDFTFSSGSGQYGGQLNIYGGEGVAFGGGVTFNSGNATGAGGIGAAITFQAGSASGPAGIGGAINFVPGYGGSVSGTVVLKGATGVAAIEAGDDGVSAARLGLFGVTPVAQPTTAITGAAFVAGAGTAVNSNSTFGGYTLAQIAAALLAIGALA